LLSPSDSDPLGEADDTIVEGDETAVGKRKYQRGKRSRQAGTQWAQTLLEVSVNKDGSRTPKRLRATFVDDRSAPTLLENINKSVSPKAKIQTDGWKGYSRLDPERHQVVNHSKSFVRVSRGKKITINALEGAHGVIKMKARNMNLFAGHPTSQWASLQQKLDELVWRFNNRSHPDLFFLFLGMLIVLDFKGEEKDLSDLIAPLSTVFSMY